jgi:ABC-type transport system substrate-binding protein
MSAQGFVYMYNDLKKFKPEKQEELKASIRQARDTFDPQKFQSLYNQLTTLLEN